MIERTLTISTAHIRQDTDERMNEMRSNGFPYRLFGHQYGWLIFIGVGDMDDSDFSALNYAMPDLMDVILFARRKKCTVINLDRDAEKIKGLKTYNW